MNFSILKNELSGWEDLSNMRNEGLLCYHSGDNLIIAKIHVHRLHITVDKLLDSYLQRLSEEVQVYTIDEQIWDGGGIKWQVKCISVYSPMSEYTVFAHAIVDGLLCSIEVILPDTKDLYEFKKQFNLLVSNIQFDALQHECGVLKLEDTEVLVTGISDICLQTQTDETLLFVGKNKYFAVTTGENVNRNLLRQAQGEFYMSLKEEGDTFARYTIKQHNGLFGVIELRTLRFGNESVNVLGYYLNGIETTIENNLLFKIKEESNEHIA